MRPRAAGAAAGCRNGRFHAPTAFLPPAPTRSLKIEVLLHAVSLGFLGAQGLLGALAAVRFVSAARIA